MSFPPLITLAQARLCLLSTTLLLCCFAHADDGIPLFPQPNSQVEFFYHSTADIKYMDNLSLEISAQFLTDSSNNTTQRLLNYYWLSGAEEQNYRSGMGVFSRMAQIMAKDYWQTIKDRHYSENHLVPDSNGSGTIQGGVNYNLRVSDDEIKLRLKYTF